jgi:hypothetical protein
MKRTYFLFIICYLLLGTLWAQEQPEKTPAPTEDKSILNEVVAYELSGKWQGKLFQQNFKGILSEEYDFELEISIDGKKVTGHSFIGVGANYAKISFSGTLDGLKVELKEIKIKDSSIKEQYLWCIKNMHLKFDFERGRYVLKGPWDGESGRDVCKPGKIKVYKKTIRA